MVLRAVICKDDPTSHGGVVLEGNTERNRHEPALIRKLRDGLGQNKSVKQLFDPWYMDANTADKIPPVRNEQRKTNRNEQTHDNHLHITVSEPKIL